MQQLLSQPLVEQMTQELSAYFSSYDKGSYIAIFLVSDDKASYVYDRMKKRFGKKVWMPTFIFGPHEFQENYDIRFESIYQKNLLEKDQLLDSIEFFNKDPNCKWIVVQLPLAPHLMQFKAEILAHISLHKDIDGLGGSLLGLSSIDYIDFLPATPLSVLKLLEYYGYADFKWKKVAVIGQSNLVWKPFAMEVMKHYGTVYSFNHLSNLAEMKKTCRECDIIVSATWAVHLINHEFLGDHANQILIDVGYGFMDGKAVGDIDASSVSGKVAALSPVPGGVGPLTVACLFWNIKILEEQKEKLNNSWQ